MWSEIKKSVSSIFVERVSSPFYGSFIFSWVVWNWKIVYLTIFISQENIKPLNKIEYILLHYNNLYYLLLWPFLSAIFLVTVVPLLSNWLFKVYLFYEKQRRTWLEQSDSTRRLTIERSAQIQNDMLELEMKHQKQVELKDNDLKVSREQIEKLSGEKLKLQENLIKLDEGNKKFKILYAQYGKNDTFSDVTSIIKELLDSANKFLVKNSVLGGDPIFGFHKELLIVFNKEGSIHVFNAKEYYEVELKDESFVALETNDSRTVYKLEASKLVLTSLESYFPGTWRLVYKGRLNGIEDVEIRQGNKYFSKALGDTNFRHQYDLTEITIDIENKKIEFTKIGIPPNVRTIKSTLNIIDLGQHYAGLEEDGLIQVSYSKS